MERYSTTNIGIIYAPKHANLLGLLPLHASSYHSRDHRWLTLKVHDLLLLQSSEVECLRSTSCWTWLSEDMAAIVLRGKEVLSNSNPFYGLELSPSVRLSMD